MRRTLRRVETKGLEKLKRLTEYLISYLGSASALSLMPASRLFIVCSGSSRSQRNLNYKDGPRPAPRDYLEPTVKEKKKKKRKKKRK